MELSVKNIKGAETGKKVILSDEIFGITPNDHAIYLDVKQYLANQRQGTHKAKQRNEIAGSTKKLKKQKGTGGARCGSIKAPTFVGGGRVFGPVPRDYSFKLNKKLKQLARRSALVYKLQEAAVTVVDSLTFETPKTKEFISMANSLAVSGKRILVVLDQVDATVILAARNLPKVKVVQAENLNTYDVMNAGAIVIGQSSAESLNELFA